MGPMSGGNGGASKGGKKVGGVTIVYKRFVSIEQAHQ